MNERGFAGGQPGGQGCGNLNSRTGAPQGRGTGFYRGGGAARSGGVV
jgi:hypothetical protein